MLTQKDRQGRSFIHWMGGKAGLADRIIELFPAHKCYCEVFAGAAWVLFKKPESKCEVINDINLDLVTLYRVVKYHLEEFIRTFKWVLVSREEFERLKRADPTTLTDIQRAARFYYLLKAGYDGRIKRPTFGTSTLRGPKFNLLRIEEELSDAHLRLHQVFVENLAYGELIQRYDRAHTLFYVDPPYYRCENYYGDGIFARADFTSLAELLGRIKGKFVMSINDAPEIRKLFRAFRIQTVKHRYTVGNADPNKVVQELLITNFEPKPAG